MDNAADLVRSLGSALDSGIMGFPVKPLFEALFILIVGSRVLKGSWQCVYAVAKWARYGHSQSPDIRESEVEKPTSPAYAEALASLSCPRPTYDPTKHALMCDGLVVLFNGGGDLTGVKSMLGNPEPDGKGGIKGTALEALLDNEEEKANVIKYAQEVRNKVITRDREEDNAKAAMAMRRARVTTRLQEMHGMPSEGGGMVVPGTVFIEGGLVPEGNVGTEFPVKFMGVPCMMKVDKNKKVK